MINTVTLVGRLGADPEFKQLKDNKNLSKFRVATWKRYLDKAEDKWKEITNWVNVVMWDGFADSVQKMKKGDIVVVTGEIKSENWEDRDGNKRTSVYVDGYVRKIADAKGGGSDTHSESSQSAPDTAQGSADDKDDLPF